MIPVYPIPFVDVIEIFCNCSQHLFSCALHSRYEFCLQFFNTGVFLQTLCFRNPH